MKTIKTISVQQFCVHYDVPVSFIDTLSVYELIELKDVDNSMHINADQINTIEKLMRLHYDLDINFEGLDVILNLLHQIDNLQQEVKHLNNKLTFYTQNL